jgi:hypothetical protein
MLQEELHVVRILGLLLRVQIKVHEMGIAYRSKKYMQKIVMRSERKRLLGKSSRR